MWFLDLSMSLFLEIYRIELLTLCMLGNFACFYGKRFGVKPNKAIIRANKKISVSGNWSEKFR